MKMIQITTLFIVVLLLVFGGCNKKSSDTLVEVNETTYSVSSPNEPTVSDAQIKPPIPPSF